MKWEHKCSLDWLRERQKYLTASDVKSLLPVTKTGRPRKVTDEDRLRVLASKLVTLTEDDCWSFGSAARGHMLEPYAVDAYNKDAIYFYGEYYYWWDDKLVTQPDRWLAFSPDAMDVSMEDDRADKNVSSILEIKSYNPERHLLTAVTTKENIEERWQIATAMALLPNIKFGTLVLFNPSMLPRQRLIYIRYWRGDLEDEIAMILKVENEWRLFYENSPIADAVLNARGYNMWHTDCSEEEIIKDIMEKDDAVRKAMSVK